MISGARYSGVPQNEKVLLSDSTPYFDNPKSVIFKLPNESNKTFSGFRSL
jgi:hypothetical protein